MENNRLWELIAKKLSGEADDKELKELEFLLIANPEAIYTMEVMEGYLRSTDQKEAFAEREAALGRNLAQLKALPATEVENRGRRAVLSRPLFRIAAAIFTSVGLLAVLYHLTQPVSTVKIATSKTVVASRGSKNQVTLPDGSRVRLNAGSTLTYNAEFLSDSVRQVTLSGEGYFEIKHDSLHPFIIRTETMDVRDIGTAFNIRSYPGDETAEATLIEGSIEVTLANSTISTVLNEPLKKIQVRKKEQHLLKTGSGPGSDNKELELITTTTVHNSTDNMLAETAWMEDVLFFSNERFEDIATRMERWYDVDIRFETEKLKHVRLTGTFSSETIIEALEEIRMMKSFQYTLVNGLVTIK